MKTCVIVPTLNEKNNVHKLIEKIRKTKIKLDVLFVDDNSNDGTQNEIKFLKKNLNLLIIYLEKISLELDLPIKMELNIVTVKNMI